MAKNQSPEVKPKTAPASGSYNSEALAKAHAKSKEAAEKRAAMSDVERAAYDVRRAGRKAVAALTTGRGNLYNLLVKNRKHFTKVQLERIVENIEGQADKIREAAFGSSAAREEEEDILA